MTEPSKPLDDAVITEISQLNTLPLEVKDDRELEPLSEEPEGRGSTHSGKLFARKETGKEIEIAHQSAASLSPQDDSKSRQSSAPSRKYNLDSVVAPILTDTSAKIVGLPVGISNISNKRHNSPWPKSPRFTSTKQVYLLYIDKYWTRTL